MLVEPETEVEQRTMLRQFIEIHHIDSSIGGVTNSFQSTGANDMLDTTHLIWKNSALY